MANWQVKSLRSATAVDEVIVYPCHSSVQDQAPVDLQDKHAVTVLRRGDKLITLTTTDLEAAREKGE